LLVLFALGASIALPTDAGGQVLAESERPWLGGTDWVGLGAPSDFNGDGYADLAIGAPYEDIDYPQDTGAVTIIYGSGAGLSSVNGQWFDQTATGSATNGLFDNFGYATGTGDFNADGFADLAIGVPNKNVGADIGAGAVSILYGSPAGLTSAGSQQWTQDLLGTDPSEERDSFGLSVASGDTNGDGFDDLAIGAATEDVSGKGDAGAVNVLFGSVSGLTSVGNQFWTQASADIVGKAEVGDQFGSSVAMGDFDGNGFRDLAVGAPRENLSNQSDAGAVNVLYGSATGLTSTGDEFWNQDSDGVNGKVEVDDWFGTSLSGGDFDGDELDDLIIGVSLESSNAGSHVGAANVLYGTTEGLSSIGDQLWTQDSEGINNKAEAGDGFGFSVSSGDFNGDGYDDATIGIDGEDLNGQIDAGAVAVIYGSVGGLDASGDQFWHQDRLGIEDSAEEYDDFGWAVAAADFGNGSETDLAVGAWGENLIRDQVEYGDAGAVTVLYGSGSGIVSESSQFWTQDSDSIPDESNYDDRFGQSVGQST
jgi:hypothetical protein